MVRLQISKYLTVPTFYEMCCKNQNLMLMLKFNLNLIYVCFVKMKNKIHEDHIKQCAVVLISM